MSTAKATFPNNPTWEQKCKSAWAENKRIEDERLTMAKQIHDFNIRLGINDTNDDRIVSLRARLDEVLKDLGIARGNLDDARRETKRLRVSLEEAEARISDQNRIAERLADEADDDVEPLDMDDEVDALTDLIRAAKAIRRRWRG